MRHHNETRRAFCGKLAASVPIGLLHPRLVGLVEEPASQELGRYRTEEQRLFAACQVRGKSSFVRLSKPSLSVRVFEAGKGEPLVLIHGGGATLAQFAPLIGSLEPDFHIYAPDRPGCGLTQKIDYTGVSIRQQAVDFMTSLFDRLQLDRAAVAGCSIGGYWGLVFALAAPQRVTKLVLLGGSAGSAPDWPARLPPPRSEQPPPTLEGIRMEYRILMANGDRASSEMLATSLAAAQIPGAALAWDSMVAQAHREFSKPMSYALRSELKNLKPPALFLMGDKDMEGPPTLAKEMAAIAPHGRFEFVPDSGHLIWLDQPSVVQRLSRDFLRSNDATAVTVSYPSGDPSAIRRIQATVSGNFGGQDKGIAPTDVEALAAAMRADGKTVDVRIYPDALHAFEIPGWDGYRPSDTVDAKQRMSTFSTRNLKD